MKNEEDMELESLELIFSKNLKQFLIFLCFVCPSFTSDTQRTFVTLQFARPMMQKLFNELCPVDFEACLLAPFLRPA
jgi:hypothetical protein